MSFKPTLARTLVGSLAVAALVLPLATTPALATHNRKAEHKEMRTMDDWMAAWMKHEKMEAKMEMAEHKMHRKHHAM